MRPNGLFCVVSLYSPEKPEDSFFLENLTEMLMYQNKRHEEEAYRLRICIHSGTDEDDGGEGDSSEPGVEVEGGGMMSIRNVYIVQKCRCSIRNFSAYEVEHKTY